MICPYCKIFLTNIEPLFNEHVEACGKFVTNPRSSDIPREPIYEEEIFNLKTENTKLRGLLLKTREYLDGPRAYGISNPTAGMLVKEIDESGLLKK